MKALEIFLAVVTRLHGGWSQRRFLGVKHFWTGQLIPASLAIKFCSALALLDPRPVEQVTVPMGNPAMVEDD